MARRPKITLHAGNMRAILPRLIDQGVTVQSVVTDAPYHLQSIVDRFAKSPRTEASMPKAGPYARQSRGFMGQMWDGGDVAFQTETWRLCWELLPPGGHLLAFGGTRTYHRMACAIEDAGFEVRDMIGWLYGTGFPKSHDTAAAIDRAAGIDVNADGWKPTTPAAIAFEGWGTALKPAIEPICVARKPMFATVARNMERHHVGGLNINGCRVNATDKEPAPVGQYGRPSIGAVGHKGIRDGSADNLGRWPANIVHDGSAEVVDAFPNTKGQLARASASASARKTQNVYGAMARGSGGMLPRGDDGSAARFYYSAKATKDDRFGTKHPTVKPVDLIRWLVRLVTPIGGTVLDPFAGSGTAAAACYREGMNAILVEREPEYVADIRRRIRSLLK